MRYIIAIFLMLIFLNTAAEPHAPKMKESNGYVEPFQMFDNLYYIGDKWVSSYAIKTSKGLVLIDTLEFPYSKWIPINLKKLGLENNIITHIFITHGHSDHVGGANYLQFIYNAKVIITKKDHELTISQSKESKGINKFTPPAVDKFPQDESHLIVGDTKFKFYITPGHTEGCLSIDFLVKDQGKSFRAFVVGGHGTNFTGIDLAEKFVKSVHRITSAAQTPPKVSVNLSNHPNKNNLFKLRQKIGNKNSENPFINEAEFFNFLKDLEKSGKNKLKKEHEKHSNRIQDISHRPTNS